ncbi:magnesium chelatase [candidate division TA06 bacterium]|nr:magnesium chelatase [candidate division TA06 bacterium]
MNQARTIGELKKREYRNFSVKEEMRRNLIRMRKKGEELFPGIIGYDRTVTPALENAILSKHDFILLGLRGQAKSRILRELIRFLDKEIPVIVGCPINDNPIHPVCVPCKELIAEKGDKVEIEWLPRERRYGEKLATPDVTMADLIGDIDPVKAASERIALSDERVINYGIIPRSNRGIFAINELPDLPPRIQVGLLNILQESDVQIRSFTVRLPLDLLIVFTANPEDYTNRGNIITPLKDRLDAQIMTHYPKTLEDAKKITDQEAWTKRDGGAQLIIPEYIQEIVERIAFEARKSDYVDQSSGISARVSISALESLYSNLERRAIVTGEEKVCARIVDLQATIPAVTGKIELVYEGEQEGAFRVGKFLIGRALKEVFSNYFPDPHREIRTPKVSPTESKKSPQGEERSVYKPIVDWFSKRNRVQISDEMPFKEYAEILQKVDGLKEITTQFLPVKGKEELATAMEFTLEGLCQNSILAKEDVEDKTSYRDMLMTMLGGMKEKESFFED